MGKKITSKIDEKKGPILHEAIGKYPIVEIVFSRTIKVDDEWVKAHFGLTDTVESIDDMDEKCELMWEKAEEQVSGFLNEEEEEPEEEEEEPEEEEEEPEEEEEEGEEEEPEEEEEEPEEEEEEGEEEEPEEEEEEGEEEEITIEEINSMTAKELKELCQNAEGLEHIKYKGMKLTPLRKEIIEALFEEEEEENEEEESDWENTDWDE